MKINNFTTFNYLHSLNKKNNPIMKKITYTFFFVSLISPFLVNNLRLADLLNNINDKKLLLKQSYILLTWFYHLSFVEKKMNKNNRVKFFVFPLKRKIFTSVKAPMAHKNWSKEQYQFKFYKLVTTLTSHLSEENDLLSTDSALLFIFLSKQNFPIFETNLLVLKNYKFFLFFQSSFYFNFHTFNRRMVNSVNLNK